jgi:hypothetical protein
VALTAGVAITAAAVLAALLALVALERCPFERQGTAKS